MDIQNVSSSATSRNASQMEQRNVNSAIVPKQVAEAAAPSPKPVEGSVTQAQLLRAIEKANQELVSSKHSLRFFVDQNTNSSVVKVIDLGSEEIIRQFPTEGALEMIADIQQYLNSVNSGNAELKEGLTGSLLNEII